MSWYHCYLTLRSRSKVKIKGQGQSQRSGSTSSLQVKRQTLPQQIQKGPKRATLLWLLLKVLFKFRHCQNKVADTGRRAVFHFRWCQKKMANWWRRAVFTLRHCYNKVVDWWRRAVFNFRCCQDSQQVSHLVVTEVKSVLIHQSATFFGQSLNLKTAVLHVCDSIWR